MAKTAGKTTEQGKGAIIEDMIVEQEQQEQQERAEFKGLNEAAKNFMLYHLARVSAGKRLANVGATLRECKSQETFAFWGSYAVPYTGFGGAHYFKAPPLNKAQLKERLKILGWQHKQAPAGYLAWAKKHSVLLTAFEQACYQQEQAAYKAAQTESPLPSVEFKPETLQDIISKISDDAPCGKILEALTVKVKERLAQLN